VKTRPVRKPIREPDLIRALGGVAPRPVEAPASAPRNEPAPATPSRADEEPALDPARISEYRRYEDEHAGFLAEVVRAFLDDLSVRLPKLEAAVGAGDAVVVREQTHTIRGAALQLGAVPLARAAEPLEEDARTGDLSRARAHLERIVGQADRLSAAWALLEAEPVP
jgi:HPt (histidine-containing phosphotransfer) domain-containing protein